MYEVELELSSETMKACPELAGEMCSVPLRANRENNCNTYIESWRNRVIQIQGQDKHPSMHSYKHRQTENNK